MEINSVVIRCAIKIKAERVQKGGNKLPIKKMEIDCINITNEGCISSQNEKDYNHYRTVSKSLKGTNDRAVSLVTNDIYENLKKVADGVQVGDLGENLTISNLLYNELKSGINLRIGEVVLEITESCISCARLGFLEWSDQLGGKSWWNKRNKSEISQFLNEEGGRGWYAKVIKEGKIIRSDVVEFYIKK